MRALLAFAAVVLVSQTSQVPATLTMGSPVAGSISGGESRIFTFSAAAGDLVSGQAELVGPQGSVQFLDGIGKPVEGTRLKRFPLSGSRGLRVGFVAPASGPYQVRLNVSGEQQGTFSLELGSLSAGARMRGVTAIPRQTGASGRIQQLSRDVQSSRPDAVNQFWREVVGKAPLIESVPGNDQDLAVTFLWRATFETNNVLVSWPMAEYRAEDYYMSHLPDTDVWYKTLRLRRGARFSYLLLPNHRREDALLVSRLDPLNPRITPEDPSSNLSWSVLETPGAPDESWFRRVPSKRGSIDKKTFKSDLLRKEHDMLVYTPAGYSQSAAPYPLLVLLGPEYAEVDSGNAATTLDNLINDGRIRPTVVCFLDSSNRGTDFQWTGVDAFGDAIGRELLPLLRSTYSISEAALDHVIGGYSAGGNAAALIAFRHPEAFGAVLSQSGGFRLRKPGSTEPNTAAQVFAEAPQRPVRFYLEVGLYDNFPTGSAPLDEVALDEGNTAGNRHFRDVLVAKGYDVIYRETPTAHDWLHWRATLADGLIALLQPTR